MIDGIHQFRDFIASCGFEPPARLEPGTWAQFSTNGKASDTAGRAKLFPDCEGGIVHDWRTGQSWTWQIKRENTRSPAELRAFREKCERARVEAQAQRARELRETAERADRYNKQGEPATDAQPHPYTAGKGITCNGLRVYRGPLKLRGMACEGALMVPRRTAGGQVVSLQFIAPDGEKRYLNGPAPPGAYFSIGKPSGTVCIAEGYATGASIHAATGYAVAVAFDAGNLEATARAVRAKLPDARLILCADDDWKVTRNGEPYNPGIEAATSAALAVGGLLAVPSFGPDRPDSATDFNDMASAGGADAVRAAVEAARAPPPAADAPEAQPSPASA